MSKRIDDKINEILEYIDELKSIFPDSFSSYINIKTKAACERYVEKLIEASIDLGILVIKYYSINCDLSKCFEILNDNNIINTNICTNLREIKSMRNVIIHNYNSVNDELVYNSIKNKLFVDILEFINQIRSHLG